MNVELERFFNLGSIVLLAATLAYCSYNTRPEPSNSSNTDEIISPTSTPQYVGSDLNHFSIPTIQEILDLGVPYEIELSQGINRQCIVIVRSNGKFGILLTSASYAPDDPLLQELGLNEKCSHLIGAQNGN